MKRSNFDPTEAENLDPPDLLPHFGVGFVLALDFPAAAKASGLSRSWLYREARLGKLRVIKAGKKSLILVPDLRAYMENLPRAKFKPVTIDADG